MLEIESQRNAVTAGLYPSPQTYKQSKEANYLSTDALAHAGT